MRITQEDIEDYIVITNDNKWLKSGHSVNQAMFLVKMEADYTYNDGFQGKGYLMYVDSTGNEFGLVDGRFIAMYMPAGDVNQEYKRKCWEECKL